MKLLIDENLSPSLAAPANELGIPTQAVRDIGLAGVADIRIWRYAWANDQTVVTANVGDFLKLAGGYELHPGVIAMREAGLGRDAQWQRLAKAVDFVRQHCNNDLINHVLELRALDVFVLHEIPPPRMGC